MLFAPEDKCGEELGQVYARAEDVNWSALQAYSCWRRQAAPSHSAAVNHQTLGSTVAGLTTKYLKQEKAHLMVKVSMQL